MASIIAVLRPDAIPSRGGGTMKIRRSPPPSLWARGSVADATASMRGHGTALGPAPHRLAIAAAPKLLGYGSAAAGAGTARLDCLGRYGDGRALPHWGDVADQPRPVAVARVRAAHGPADGRGADRFADFQPRLRGAGGKKPDR